MNYRREMVFVDSSGNVDRQNCRQFVVLTHSPSGLLPLAVVIMSSESQSTLTEAFALMQSILPEGAFHNSTEEPAIFMTDDCAALRAPLHTSSFPALPLPPTAGNGIQRVTSITYTKKNSRSQDGIYTPSNLVDVKYNC